MAVGMLTCMNVWRLLPCLMLLTWIPACASTTGRRVAAQDQETGGAASVEVISTDDFVVGEGETLVINEDTRIEATGAIVLRGTVRVEVPADAPQGTWAPQLALKAGERIVITGPLVFGDGRDGVDPGVMGGAGASLFMQAPVIAIGVQEIRMGNGGHGGPDVEGGPGGLLSIGGWVIPFHGDGLVLRGGDGGDAGDGTIGTEFHPRGHRGGNGGEGGGFAQLNPVMGCRAEELPGYLERAIGTDPALDPYLIGPHRLLPRPARAFGGDAGDGGPPFPPMGPKEGAMAGKAGGGRGGDGGNGGNATGTSGLPGTTVTPADEPPAGGKWNGGKGSNGGDARGGKGGDGGNTGPDLSGRVFVNQVGGRGGRGGRAIGGRGGDAGIVDPPPRYSRFEGRAGEGGAGIGGGGGNGGNGHSGGDAGDGGSSRAGDPGDTPGTE